MEERMSKILFTNGNSAASGALGPIVRFLAIAQELKNIEPNIHIAFRTAGSEKAFLVLNQYEVCDGYAPHLFGLPSLTGRIVEKFTEISPGRPIPPIPNMEFVLKLKGILNPTYIQTTFREEMQLLDEFQPDCVYGSMDLVMPIAAKKMGIRYVPIGSAVMLPGFRSPLFPEHKAGDYTALVNPLLKKIGLPQVTNIKELLFLYYSSNILVPSIAEMEELPSDEKIIYSGSILPERITAAQFHWEKKRPLIFVYLSVGQITPKKYMKVLVDSFARSEFDVIVAAGDHPYFRKHDTFTEGNVHFFRFVPGEEVLKSCDLAIHHGGQNSTVQAIENTVPSLIYPGLHFERHFNARKAEEVGCARIMRNEEFQGDALLNTAREVFNDPQMKANLERYAGKIRMAGGRRKAAEVILNKDWTM
jgi:UDP:flavonoid glycosyltransferase YjiC (YdhE family)